MSEYLTIIQKDTVELVLYTSERETNLVTNAHLIYPKSKESDINGLLSDLDTSVIEYSHLEEKLKEWATTWLVEGFTITRMKFDVNSDNITYKLNRLVKIASEESKEKWTRVKIM